MPAPKEEQPNYPSINSLKNKGIVITRPKQQAKSLARNIEKVGGCPFLFPLIEITPLNDDVTQKKLSTIEYYDVIIFISINALEQCINLIGTKPFKNKIIVTTGKKTARAVIRSGLKVDYCPEQYFNSEALLTIDKFKEAAKGKKIAIIRGSSGRDYLKNNLIDLGASVDYIDVYKRHCPQQDLNKLKTLWEKSKLDVILLTSASSTASFFNLVDLNDIWINKITILIGSSRMQHEIPKEFKGNILVAEDPSDETLFKKLIVELN